MIVDVALPDQRAGIRVERVDVCGTIADERYVAIGGLEPSDRNGRAHRGVRREGPMHASGRCAQRVHHAALRSNEHATTGDGWLAVGAELTRESECPLQFELRHVAGSETGHLAVLVPGVLRVRAPAIPRRAG